METSLFRIFFSRTFTLWYMQNYSLSVVLPLPLALLMLFCLKLWRQHVYGFVWYTQADEDVLYALLTHVSWLVLSLHTIASKWVWQLMSWLLFGCYER